MTGDICEVSVTSSHKAHALELVPDFMSEVTSEGRTHVLLLGDKPSDFWLNRLKKSFRNI